MDADVTGVSLVVIGVVLLAVGVLGVIASFTRMRRRIAVSASSRTSLSEVSSSNGRRYRGLVVPLHYPSTQLTFAFKEVSGRPVDVKVMDLIANYGGQHIIMTYAGATASVGSVSVTLQPGTYDVHVTSTDDGDRDVEYSVLGIELTFPFERFREVALAIATVGAVLISEGVVVFATS